MKKRKRKKLLKLQEKVFKMVANEKAETLVGIRFHENHMDVFVKPKIGYTGDPTKRFYSVNYKKL